jgi:hypothetical protein
MFRASTTHHQEVRYVANGTSNMAVRELGWSSAAAVAAPRLADSHLRSTICHIHTYTLPPDDGLLMPETCRGTLIQ